MRHAVLIAVVVTAAGVVAVAQFVPDTTFRPPIEKPAFLPQKGPVVLLDEATSITTRPPDGTCPSRNCCGGTATSSRHRPDSLRPRPCRAEAYWSLPML